MQLREVETEEAAPLGNQKDGSHLRHSWSVERDRNIDGQSQRHRYGDRENERQREMTETNRERQKQGEQEEFSGISSSSPASPLLLYGP